MIRKIFGSIAALALVAGFFAVQPAGAVEPEWDLTGAYTANLEYLGSNNEHEITLVQDPSGNLTGSGTSGGGAFTYTIDSGLVDGSNFSYTATYTDPVALGTVMTVEGTVSALGELDGTWTDNFGGTRTGDFMSTEGVAEPIEDDDVTTVVVTGDTSAGENQPGWLFNRDVSTSTPFEFNEDQASIGAGSLYVEPIGATPADKFIGENFINSPIADVESISYDFLIGSGGADTEEEHFYMNVYANFGVSDDTKFYDCRYNVVPTVGSTAAFTTVTFDPTLAYPVTQSGTSPFTCPAIPADMDLQSAGSTIRVFALNVGDTSASDEGLDGYLDNVVVAMTDGTTIYDFELNEPAEEDAPVVTNVAFDGTTLTADADDSATGNSNIASAEYTIDGGTAVAMAAADGTFDEPTEGLTATAGPLAEGTYEICVTATDAAGNTSEAACTTYVQGPPVVGPPVSKDECKNGGWMAFNNPAFKNQGQCVSYVNQVNNQTPNAPEPTPEA